MSALFSVSDSSVHGASGDISAEGVPEISPASGDGYDRSSQTFQPIKDSQKPDSDWRARHPSQQPPRDATAAAVVGSSSSRVHDGEARLRERLLRGNLKPTILRKESIERRLRGPLVARRGATFRTGAATSAAGGSGSAGGGGACTDALSGGAAGAAAGSGPMPDLVVPQKKSLRPTSPTYESAFRRHVVNRPASPGIPRRRPSLALSPSNSFNKAKRTPSPNVAEASTEIMRKKAEKARKAKMYLLQQAGPNSFIIASEGIDGKVKVVVGPQSCSCGKGASGCIHILFVMLRVFQLDENDGLVWSRQLRNFEVETLFNNFHMRRTHRIRSSLSLTKRDDSSADSGYAACQAGHEASSSGGGNGSTSRFGGNERHGSGDSLMKEDEETTTCPICLLQMKEGEQLVLCEACRNLLHQQCMSVWFRLCSRQGDQLSCPLCRAKWRHLDPESLSWAPDLPPEDDTSEPPLALESSSSAAGLPGAGPLLLPPQSFQHHQHSTAVAVAAAASQAVPPDVVATLPRSEPVPEESMSQAAPWIELFGNDLVGCIFSRNWVVRETALRHLSRESVKMLVLRAQPTALLPTCGSADVNVVLERCCQILAMMCADPVYKVYVAALRALRTLLSYASCTSEGSIAALQTYLQPVLHSILLKCADSNRRTSQLSLSTLSEFAKGQAGELAISTEIRGAEAQEGLGGLLFVLRSALEDFDVATAPWQWLLGRLATMEKLMDEFPADFSPPLPADAGPAIATVTACAPIETALYSVIRFSLKSMKLAHTRVLRTAKKVFLAASRYALLLSPSALQRIRDMLALVDLGMQSRLEKRLLEMAQRTACLDPAATGVGGGGHGSRAQLTVVGGGGRPASAPQSRVPSPSPYSYDSDGWAYNNAELAAVSSFAFGGSSRSKTAFGCLYQPVPTVGRTSPSPPRHDWAASATSTTERVASRQLSGDSSVDGATAEGGDDRLVVRRETGGSGSRESRQHKALHRRSASYTHAVDGMEERMDDTSAITVVTTTGPAVEREAPAAEQTKPGPSVAAIAVAAVPDGSRGTAATAADAPLAIQQTSSTGTRTDESSSREGQHEASISNAAKALLLPRIDSDASASSSSSSAAVHHSGGTAADQACAGAGAAAGASSGSGDEQKTSDSSVLLTEDLSELSIASPSENAMVSFKSEVALFSPLRRTPDNLDGNGGSSGERLHCKDDVELEEAIALARAMDVSMHQEDLPRIPGLCNRKEEETITIHVQESGAAGSVQYLENVHWRRGKTLGTGAFSTCYQARDSRTGILMAVKQISFCRNTMSEQEKVCHAVREEIEMMARLNHPHIVRILGATQTGCHFNMFVEWMPGGSIAHLLDLYGSFSEPVISSYVHQVLMGLAYLHDNHVLHRDLKGANLLVDSTGKHLRIGDFGACARLATSMTGAGEFRGQMLGTIAFMAPEVLRGEHYGRACDVWGVGCVMIEMATTRPPWSASIISNHLKLIFMIASSTSPPPIPDNMSPAVKDLMLRCLETNPAFRPSARELLQHPLFTRYLFRSH